MNTDVLIAGAGPTGLALAVDLARRGVDALVVEASPEPLRQSRGKGLQPRSLEVLDDLGVAGEVLAAGAWRQDITLYKDGRRLARLGAGSAEPRPDLPYPNIVMIPQWRLTAILRDRLSALGGRLLPGARLLRLSSGPGGAEAVLRREDGTEETARARFLIGCDGGRSTVRKEIGASFEGATRETHRYLLGDVTIPGWDPMDGDVVASHAWLGGDGSFLGLAGLPGTGQWQFGADTGDGEPEATLASLQRLWDERTGRTDVRISEATWISRYTVNVRMADRYRSGPVLLAGDAAHVHPPTGGQGMNTGIQDAYNLGWKLAAVLAGAPDSLLDSYQAERLPVARDVLARSTDILDVVMSPNPLVAFAVQRLVLPLLSRPRINRALAGRVSQIDVGYPDGPLNVPGRRVSRLRPGQRVPDARLAEAESGRSVRLHRLMRGPAPVLLAGGREALDGVDAAAFPADRLVVIVLDDEPYTGATAVRDPGGALRRALRIERSGALLIRPDGHLLWQARRPTTREVAGHLDRISGPAGRERPPSGRPDLHRDGR